jgi:hypothetical protein
MSYPLYAELPAMECLPHAPAVTILTRVPDYQAMLPSAASQDQHIPHSPLQLRRRTCYSLRTPT